MSLLQVSPEVLEYKCEDCEYWGQNELTMEIHTGRCYSEHFECGLCAFKAKTLENLETHPPPLEYMIVISASLE